MHFYKLHRFDAIFHFYYFNYASYVGKKHKICTFIIKNLYIYKKSSTFVRFLEN